MSDASDILVICEPVLDRTYSVGDYTLTELGIEKGSWNEGSYQGGMPEIVSCAGTTGNIALNLVRLNGMIQGNSHLGGVPILDYLGGRPQFTTTLYCPLSDDKNSLLYRSEVNTPGLNLISPKGSSPTLIDALITPDGERTFLASNLSENNLPFHENKIPLGTQKDYLIISGYELSRFDGEHLVDYLSRSPRRIVLDLASPHLIERDVDLYRSAVRFSDYVLISEEEYLALTGKGFGQGKIDPLLRNLELVIKKGSNGSMIYLDGEITYIPGLDIPLKDFKNTNGAGDAFLSGYVVGEMFSDSLQGSANLANAAAYEVITRFNSNLM